MADLPVPSTTEVTTETDSTDTEPALGSVPPSTVAESEGWAATDTGEEITYRNRTV